MVAAVVLGREFDVRRFESLDSTNRWLLDEARRGAPEGLVAVAAHQTAGRGRLGRVWEAPPGSALLCSVLFRPDLPVERMHLVVAAVSLAARDALGGRPTIKWPNDLMLDGAKVAGVLAEADLPAVVVGTGVNVTWAPPGAAFAGGDPDEVLDGLLAGLRELYGEWPLVAERYAAECSTVGQRVRVELASEVFEGTAERLTPEGHLVVDGRVVTAGDVVHLRPA